MGLIIRSSAIHAAGCYTTARIPKGKRVAEYTGPRLSKDEADELYKDSILTYLFGLGDGSTVIDGHCMAMFINHSCDANCETGEEDGRVWITAIKNIPPGQEITYDYCLYDGGDDEAVRRHGAAVDEGRGVAGDENEYLGGVAEAVVADGDPAHRIGGDMVEKDQPEGDAAEQVKPQIALGCNHGHERLFFRAIFRP